MNALAEAPLALACAVTLASAWTDARTGRIPNLLTLPVLPLGMLLGAANEGWAGVGLSALGILLCFSVPYVLFRSSRGTAIGGGDVKLFAALGALLGPNAGLEVELASLVLLAVFALVALTWRGQLLKVLQRSLWLCINWVLPKARRRQVQPEMLVSMRLGPAICVATWGFATLELLPGLLA
jgi:prepilin peptidase CpaA